MALLSTNVPASVQYSHTTLTKLMILDYANFGDKIHGGTLLSLMAKVAYACAAKHTGKYYVTVSVDGVKSCISEGSKRYTFLNLPSARSITDTTRPKTGFKK